MIGIVDAPGAHGEKTARRQFGQAFLVGLAPLALLVALVAGMLLAIGALRPMLATYGFFEQQTILMIVVTAGLLLVTLAYAIVCRSTLKRIRVWQHAGHSAAATGGHWALLITSIAVILPIIAGLFLH
jgi:hypothetical protein